MPNIVRVERWPGTTPGRKRAVKVLACECGEELALSGYSGTPCACRRTYNLDGWQIGWAAEPKETDHA